MMHSHYPFSMPKIGKVQYVGRHFESLDPTKIAYPLALTTAPEAATLDNALETSLDPKRWKRSLNIQLISSIGTSCLEHPLEHCLAMRPTATSKGHEKRSFFDLAKLLSERRCRHSTDEGSDALP